MPQQSSLSGFGLRTLALLTVLQCRAVLQCPAVLHTMPGCAPEQRAAGPEDASWGWHRCETPSARRQSAAPRPPPLRAGGGDTRDGEQQGRLDESR